MATAAPSVAVPVGGGSLLQHLLDCWIAGLSGCWDFLQCWLEISRVQRMDSTNQQEVVLKGLSSFSPLTFFFSYLMLRSWKGLEWNRFGMVVDIITQ